MKKLTLAFIFVISLCGWLKGQSTNAQDSLALLDLYTFNSGVGWINKTNWTTGPVSSWFGVTLNGLGRVVAINLPNNNVFGVIQNSFANLTALTTLNLSGNTINTLPAAFSGMSSLAAINLANNNLTFEDLEPIISMPGLTYSPQKLFGSGGAGSIISGNAIKFEQIVGGTSNSYQWRKDGVDISGATGSSIVITNNAVLSDAGIYQVAVTNSLVPGLTLLCNNISITVISPGAQSIFNWPTNNGITDDLPAESYGGFWADIDNDNDEDLMVVNLQPNLPTRGTDLYRNNGNGTFTKLLAAGNPTNFSPRNVTWADWNNDGFLDFHSGIFAIAADGGLFINNKNNTFSRINTPPTVMGATFVDYDNDGRIDLSPISSFTGEGLPMYKNVGNNTFQILPDFFNSASAPEANTQWVNLYADIDGDNDQDLLQVGNNTSIGVKKLFKNNGNGTFTEETSDIIVTDNLVSSRGASWADIDNDGDLDLFAMNATTAGTVQSAFYMNDGNGSFSKELASTILGVDVRGRGCVFGDVDNDGDQDLVLNNGVTGNVGTRLFLNNGTGLFNQVDQSNQSFLNVNALITHLSMADYDNNGYLDIYSSTFNVAQPASLYRNVGGTNKWIKVRLRGTVSNRAGIGAKVKIKSGGKWQFREVNSQNALVSQSSLLAHFGIGTDAKIDSLVVQWPSGIQQIILNQIPNKLVTITESAPAPKYISVVMPEDGALGVRINPDVTTSSISGSTLFTVQLSKSIDFSAAILEVSGSDKMHSYTGLEYGTLYFARAKTNLTDGFGPITKFTTGTAEGFAYVKYPVDGATGVSTNAKLTLNTVVGATSYTVEINTAQDFSGPQIPQQSGNTVGYYTFNNLTFNTVYYTRVKTDLSPNWGPVKSFTTTTAAQASFVVTPANNATNVSWRPTIVVSNIGNPPSPGYTVQLSLTNTFSTVEVEASSTTTSIELPNNLAYNTTYFTRVTSTLSPGLYGPVRSFTTGSPQSMSYVATPSNNATNVPYVINVVSVKVPDATSYTIELNTDSNFGAGTAITKVSATRSVSFTLQHNTQYFSRVYTNLDPGNWGITRSFTTGNPVSLAFVTSPKNGGTGVPNTVLVTSNKVPGATNYTIELNTASDFTGTSLVYSGVSSKNTFSGLSSSTTYFARVQTNLAVGQWGASTSFTTVNPGARSGSDWMEEELQDEAILPSEPVVSIYPVPFKRVITIHAQTERQEAMQVRLYDLSGREVIRQEGKTNQFVEIIGENLNPGLYLVKVISPSGLLTVRKIMRELD